MALLSRKEFEAMCGLKGKHFSTYKNRGKIVVLENGMIDTADALNASFIQKTATHISQLPPEPITEAKPFQLTLPDGAGTTVDLTRIPAYSTSETLLKYLDTQKREEEIKKLRLDLEKKRGEVVPVEPLDHLIFRFKQYILTQQKITNEAFLNEVTHKYTVTPEDMAYFRGFFIKGLNAAITEATEAFLRDLDTVLSEFSVKKSVGEKAA
jgi:hypothetical protein